MSQSDHQDSNTGRQTDMTETADLEDLTSNKIVDFDAGEGETAAVEINAYSDSLNAAKAKSVRLVDAISGAQLKRKAHSTCCFSIRTVS